jgi:putative copper resistance protein D
LQWCEAATLGDTSLSEAGPAFALLLQSTHYGHAGLAGLTALLGLTGAHLIFKIKSGMTVITVLFLFVVALSKVAVSHAGEAGLFSGAAAIELLHLLLIWFWTGSVWVSGWHVLANVGKTNPAVSNYLKSLSFYATLALCGIVTTGLLNAMHILWRSGDLAGQPYTTMLLIKIGLVLLAAVLGGFNRFTALPDLVNVVTPSARQSMLLNRFVFVLKTESMVLITALFIAAALAATAPP